MINANYKILLTIKFRSQKLSSESTIYNSFRLKKTPNNLFQLKKTITSILKKICLLKYPNRNLSHNNNINNNS